MRKLVGLLLVATLQPALAADMWGCEVLLCLSNPAGPMAVKECIPPIQRLYKSIFKWRPDPFPTCQQARGPDNAGNYAEVAYVMYSPCPRGMVPLSEGATVVVGTPEQVAAQNADPAHGPLVSAPRYTGIGEGSTSPYPGDNPAPKTCVSQYLGLATFASDETSDVPYTFTLGVFDRVYQMGQSMHGVINVYQNGQLINVINQ